MSTPHDPFGGSEAIERAFAELSSGARWLTLTGPIGVGKRRRAEAIAARLGAHVRLLRTTVPSEATRAAIRAHLDEDPSNVVVATSLVAFGEPEEHVVPVAPLSLADSLALFDRLVGSAASARPETHTLLASLDGLPLAIEVAAAAAPILGFGFSLEDLLALSEVAGAPNRLSAILEDALVSSGADVAALERLALFEGELDLDDARAMIGADAPVVVYALVRLTWLQAVSEGRFRLLGPARAFLRRRLRAAPEREADARRTHALHVLERSAPSLDDVTSAVRWAVESARPVDALKLVLRAEAELHRRAHDAAFRRLLDDVIALARAQELRSADFACALRARGRVARALGEHDAARADLEDACRIARELPPKRGARILARCSIELAELAAAQGDLRAVDEAVERALEAARECDAALASEITRRAAVLRQHTRPDDDASLALHAESVALARRSGDRRALALALGSFVVALLERRDLEGFRRLWPEAWEELSALDDVLGLAILESTAAIVAALEGRAPEARERFERALATFRRFGDRKNEAIVALDLGWLALDVEDPSATRRFEQAIEAARAGGIGWLEVKATAGLAVSLARAGRSLEASVERRRAEEGALAHSVDVEVPLACVAVLDVDALHAQSDSGNRTLEAARQLLLSESATSIADAAPRRLLARWLDEVERVDTRPTLLVANDGAWFRAPTHEWVDLRKRPTLRRVLVRLAQASLEGVEGIATPVLFAEGWPGERVMATAAAARVHVAMNTLRGLGLRGVLERGESGYRIRDDVRVLMGSFDPTRSPAPSTPSFVPNP